MEIVITPTDNPVAPIGSVQEPDLRQAILAADRLKRANLDLCGVILHRPSSLPPTGAFNWATLNAGQGFSSLATKENHMNEQVPIKSERADPDFLARYGHSFWFDPSPMPKEWGGVRERDVKILKSMFDVVAPCSDTIDRIMGLTHTEDALFFGQAVRYLPASGGLVDMAEGDGMLFFEDVAPLHKITNNIILCAGKPLVNLTL